ncbi:response regulator [Hyalangium rubrum]|uniref:Response regulator n=1 Tax=Hyalangium rubrum TaxID=3103134 RepID=A0ABU5GWJ0_9BACT|nr:response regulator [Hyalangium sp. s54d21]MDY7225461.1 response regulator [Hyalangium sp. s54d21]
MDDSSTIRAAVKFILGGQELELLMAEDGRQGVDTATRELPDLILMDVEMPHLDGFSACRQLRQQESTRHIPIILITSRGAQVDVARGYESGCTLYLTKPFDEERLRGVVKRFLSRSGAGQREAAHGTTG